MTPIIEAKQDQKRLEALLADDRRAIDVARKQRARQRLQARRVEQALREAREALRQARNAL